MTGSIAPVTGWCWRSDYLGVLVRQGLGQLVEGGGVHGDEVGGQLVLGDVHEGPVVRAVHVHLQEQSGHAAVEMV